MEKAANQQNDSLPTNDTKINNINHFANKPKDYQLDSINSSNSIVFGTTYFRRYIEANCDCI